MRTAKSILKYNSSEEYASWIKARPEYHHYKSSIVKSPDNVDKKAAPAVAYVNEGDWIADCPSGCGAAMWIDPDLPFMCGFCFNIELGGRWRKVVWPAEKAQIEVLLSKRLIHRNRNWKPGETAKELEAENTTRGII